MSDRDVVAILQELVDAGPDAEDRTISFCYVMYEEGLDEWYEGPSCDEFNTECDAAFEAVQNAWGTPDYDGHGIHARLESVAEAARVAFWHRSDLLAMVVKNNGDGGLWQFLTLGIRKRS